MFTSYVSICRSLTVQQKIRGSDTSIYEGLNMKNIISATPLKVSLKADVFALKDSADAFVALFTKKGAWPACVALTRALSTLYLNKT